LHGVQPSFQRASSLEAIDKLLIAFTVADED